MVKTMDAEEHRTLLHMLPGLCRHLHASCDARGQPRSLLTRISGVYSIRMYTRPRAGPVPALRWSCARPVLRSSPPPT